MPPTPPTQRMGELHEIYLAKINGGTKSKASGSQWHDPADGRNRHDDPFAFAWDGKSTKAKSLTITLDMIAKIRDQAIGERPQLGLRWYGNDQLSKILEDWIMVQGTDWEEVLPAARAFIELQAALGGDLSPERVTQLLANADERETLIGELREEVAVRDDEIDSLRTGLGAVLHSPGDPDGLHSLRELLKARDAEIAELRRQLEQSRPAVPENIPRLPWTVIHETHLIGRTALSGEHYGPDGHITQVEVRLVQVERTHDGHNRPQLMVNGTRVRQGDLYVDGKRHTRVCAADRSIEEG